MSRFIDDHFDAQEIYPPQQHDEEQAYAGEGPCNYNLVRGHFHYEDLKKKGLTGNFVALLRDPKNRIISEYYQILRTTPAAMRQFPSRRVVVERVKGMDVAEFIKSRANIQTRFFSSPKPCLKTALSNLDHMALVGCTEELSLFSTQLCQLMRWPQKKLSLALNQTTSREKSSIDWESDHLQSVIKNSNNLDRQLYDYAKDLVQQQLQNLPSFTEQLGTVAIKNQYLFCNKLEGRGWHQRECFNPHSCFRWTSAPTATLNLQPDIQSFDEVHFDLLASKVPNHQINIWINGQSCDVQLSKGSANHPTIVAKLKSRQMGRAHVEIKIGTPVPTVINLEKGDQRVGGIAVSKITFVDLKDPG